MTDSDNARQDWMNKHNLTDNRIQGARFGVGWLERQLVDTQKELDDLIASREAHLEAWDETWVRS